MSHQRNSSLSPVLFKKFGGEDQARSHQNAPLCGELVNFRILSDGTLEKRCGYRFLTEFEEKPRAFWSGMIDCRHTGYAVSGNQLVRVDLIDGTKELLATLHTTEGFACLFFWDRILHLMDSSGIYRYDEDGLHTATGYIPLIGKDWPSAVLGEPYEPINLLSRRVRISYVVDPDFPTSFFCSPEPVASIDAVYLNGEKMSEEDYYYYDEFQTVNVPGLAGNDRLLVYLTLAGNVMDDLGGALGYNHSLFYESATSPRLFFWNDQMVAPMICSSYVERSQIKELLEHGFQADTLYIPKGYAFTVGDNNVKIQGAIRQQDKLLIFTENSTWKADASVSGMSDIPTVNVSTHLGCSSPTGIVVPENDPIVLSHHTIRRWSASSNRDDLYHTASISKEIDPILSSEDFRSAFLFYHQGKDELWLTQPSTGDLWIYDMTEKHWVRFGEIFADRLFDVDGAVGFLRENVLYVFDESLKVDRIREDEFREISAVMETSLLDFGSEGKKNLSHVVLRADPDGEEIDITLRADSLPPLSRSVTGRKGESHSILRVRLPSGRFQTASLRLTAGGTGRQRIHSLEIYPR